MNDFYHTDDLEDFLQKKAGEHRMYPSDHVWKNIRRKIHTPKKWPALSVFTVFIISALVVGTILNKPQPDTVNANFTFSLQNSLNNPADKTNPASTGSKALTDQHYAVDQITAKTITAAVEKIKVEEAAELQMMQTEKSFANTTQLANSTDVINTSLQQTRTNNKNAVLQPLVAESANNSTAKLNSFNYYRFDVTSRLRNILNTKSVVTSKSSAAFFSPKHVNFSNDFDIRVKNNYTDIIPSALERLSKTSSRFDFRFYVAPSISYRRLKEKPQNESLKTADASLESNYTVEPSKAINHSAAAGYETGFGLGYKLNNKFTLTGGFQFNISQYKINAFLYKDEPTTVILDNGNFANTVNTVSSLRSIAGSMPLTIKNRYYQISMPLGIDWKAWGSTRLTWGIAGSLQPTYTFDKQPLIITSNYKNYTDGSAYVRNWNLNANAETYLGYTTGGYRWQLGPQIRYQMLPSLVDKYPNKEYLINYGFKIGVVKQLK